MRSKGRSEAPQLDEFEHLVLGGALHRYTTAQTWPFAAYAEQVRAEAHAKLLLALTMVEGPAHKAAAEAARHFRAGHEIEGLSAIVRLLEAGSGEPQ
jgi:hypothetical protein